MEKRKIDPTELKDNAINIISQDWMLITSGTPEKFNTMTASWGGIGYIWNKPVAFVFIRPERYTHQFIEENDNFTITFFGKEYKQILTLMGSKSGRDIDKMNNSGLTPYFTELGTPAFEEARITIECKKLYSDMLEKDSFIDKSLTDIWYTATKGGFHKMYIAEIINIWI